jgi:hypothetical protein
MTRHLYRSVCVHAGKHRGGYLPQPVSLEHGLDLPYSIAVYIACNYFEQVVYVGSVRRSSDPRGLERRIAAHLRDSDKSEAWRTLWVIPLRADASLHEVRRIEGLVGAHLRPPGNRRLPGAA